MSIVDKVTRRQGNKGLRCAGFVLRHKNIRTYFSLSVLLFFCQSHSFVFRYKNIKACFSLSVFLFLCLFFSACDRRDITYYMESEIIIEADWSLSELEEAGFGATVVFFPEAGGEPVEVLMGTRERATVRLPEGRYHALIFNRSPRDFGGISFEGETFHGYKARAKQVETRVDPDTRAETRVIVGTPERLAGDGVEGFEVTEAMLGNYSTEQYINSRNTRNGCNAGDTRGSGSGSDTRASEEHDLERYIVRFTPRKLTQDIVVQVRTPGINNIRSVVGTLDNVSEYVYVGKGEPSGERVVQQFTLPDIEYDENSAFNGTLSGRVNVFGFDTGLPHILTLKALLVDGKTVVEQRFDVQAHTVEEEGGSTVIRIEVEAEKLPDVKPEGDPDSGFDATVDDWGDTEHVEL